MIIAGIFYAGLGNFANCEVNNMAEGPCDSCKTLTKYNCINCSSFICNRVACSLAELDENTAGWIAQQSVAYCKSCANEIISNSKDPKEQPPIKKTRTKSNETKSPQTQAVMKVKVLILNYTRRKRHQMTRRRKKEKGRARMWLAGKLCGKKQILMI